MTTFTFLTQSQRFFSSMDQIQVSKREQKHWKWFNTSKILTMMAHVKLLPLVSEPIGLTIFTISLLWSLICICVSFAEDGRLMADAESGEFWGFFGGFAPLPRKTANDEDKTYTSDITQLFW